MATVARIRERAISKMPYLARALFSLTPVASEKVPVSMTADAYWRVYYNPQEILDYDEEKVDEAAIRLCRETARLLQGHPRRLSQLLPEGGTREYYRQVGASVSTALANQLVNYQDARSTHLHQLPGWSKIKDMPQVHTLEGVYRNVCDNLPKPDPNGDQPQPDGEGSQQSPPDPRGQPQQGQPGSRTQPSSGGAPNAPRQQQPDREQSQEQNKSPSIQNQHNSRPEECGSSMDGEPRSWELAAPPPPKTGEESKVEASAAQSPVDEDSVKDSVAESIERLHGSGQGDQVVPDGVRQWARQHLGHIEVNKPQDLVSLIQEFSETQAGYQMRRHDGRNRRQQQISAYSNQEISLARDFAPKVDILVVLDTSGSMDERGSYIALKYIARVLQSLNVHHGAVMYTGDREPQYWGRITPHGIDDLTIDGQGGTDMPKVITKAHEANLDRGGSANIVICVTDGETDWEFEQPLPVPLIIAVVPLYKTKERLERIYRGLDRCSGQPVPPDWANVTVIDVQEAERCV